MNDAVGLSDCERIRRGVLMQPVNARTSFAYLAAAAGVVAPAMRSGGGQRVALIPYAASLASLGIDCLVYHGLQPRWVRPAE
jgi:hypothetical protein